MNHLPCALTLAGLLATSPAMADRGDRIDRRLDVRGQRADARWDARH